MAPAEALGEDAPCSAAKQLGIIGLLQDSDMQAVPHMADKHGRSLSACDGAPKSFRIFFRTQRAL